MGDWLTWREATVEALYGTNGFYRRSEGPAGHYRTSVHVSPLFARALLRLIASVDEALGRPDRLDVVDVGAARGELLGTLAAEAPEHAGSLGTRLALCGVEVTGRPPDLPEQVGWTGEIPQGVTGVVLANEWLDNVPCEVVERTSGGIQVVLVDPVTGSERPGPPPLAEDYAWLGDWWPLNLAEVGERAEVGRARDEAWARAVAALDAGLAVAIDYMHTRGDRMGGLLPSGTLTGYRAGRVVVPVPDGSCDLTCHVALDACAAAGDAAGATSTVLVTQREALDALGLHASMPGRTLAQADPEGYLRELQLVGEAGELTARGGLGDFGWLLQAVALPSVPLLGDS